MIARGDGTPLYNFAVAVDDAEMRITDVIRGDDHLRTPRSSSSSSRPSAPTRPAMPTCRCCTGPTARSSPSATALPRCRSCARAASLPAAVRNYLALLGWGTDDDATILPTPELVERFSLERVGRSAAIFDERKLRWLNGRYMREMPLEDYVERGRRAPRARGPRGGARRPRPPAPRLRDRPGQGPDPERGLAADPGSCSSRRSTTRRRGAR